MTPRLDELRARIPHPLQLTHILRGVRRRHEVHVLGALCDGGRHGPAIAQPGDEGLRAAAQQGATGAARGGDVKAELLGMGREVGTGLPEGGQQGGFIPSVQGMWQTLCHTEGRQVAEGAVAITSAYGTGGPSEDATHHVEHVAVLEAREAIAVLHSDA